MTRQTQPDHGVALGLQPLTEGPEGVRGITQPMQKKNTPDRLICLEDTGPVPQAETSVLWVAWGSRLKTIVDPVLLTHPRFLHQVTQLLKNIFLLLEVVTEMVIRRGLICLKF